MKPKNQLNLFGNVPFLNILIRYKIAYSFKNKFYNYYSFWLLYTTHREIICLILYDIKNTVPTITLLCTLTYVEILGFYNFIHICIPYTYNLINHAIYYVNHQKVNTVVILSSQYNLLHTIKCWRTTNVIGIN